MPLVPGGRPARRRYTSTEADGENKKIARSWEGEVCFVHTMLFLIKRLAWLPLPGKKKKELGHGRATLHSARRLPARAELLAGARG